MFECGRSCTLGIEFTKLNKLGEEERESLPVCWEKDLGNVAPALWGRGTLQLWLQVADVNVLEWRSQKKKKN